MTRIVNDNVADAQHQLAQRHEGMLAGQAHSELVLANITDTHILFDRNWRYIYVNDAATRAIGLSREQILEHTLWELFPDIIGTELDRQYRRAMDERETVEFDFHYLTQNTWWANRFYPTDFGLGVVATEITERKRTEEELRKTQAELAHVTRVTTLGELTVSIAHEVNQPLGAIVTNGHACLRLLSRTNPDIDEARRAVECMIADGIRASEVIKRIRGFLKKSRGGKSSCNINDNIREVLALTAGELTKNGVNVRTELAHGLPYAIVDRVQVQQVVLNLILNSKEAMSGPGWQSRELLIKSEQAGPEIVVSVTDTGVGIAPENRESAFVPFFTSKEGGLGFGLSISRTIVEAHNGRLWTKPGHNGQGTTFQFSLPTGENL
jgi:PAS domain S-box-containing protein